MVFNSSAKIQNFPQQLFHALGAVRAVCYLQVHLVEFAYVVLDFNKFFFEIHQWPSVGTII